MMSEKSGDVSDSSSNAPEVAVLKTAIELRFPDLWPAVSIGLATCATLLLADNANPTALIYTGAASSGKTTVATMFEGALVIRAPGKPPEPLCHRSDKFTPAAFVSQAANRTAKELDGVDLLPKINGRVLLTPELAPIFRGNEDELTRNFAIITRVLDGQGLVTDSGTHGHREPPRVFRRLQTLRGWGHDASEPVFTGSAGAGGADGGRARAGACLAVGGDHVDRREDRVRGRDPAELGATGRA
jgi:hypothetical protein